MPVHQTRSPVSEPQTAAPAVEAPTEAGGFEEPEWNYAFSAGNATVLSLIAGTVDTDDETAGLLLHGSLDAEETATGAPEEGEEFSTENAPKAIPVAPPTTDPGGVYSKPFQRHQRRIPATKVTLTASQKAELKTFQDNWVAHKGRYQRVAAQTGVPAELIAAIHYRESSLDFGTYLHQGDPLGKKAVHVPRNIPVFHEWEAAAVHALNMKRGLRDNLGMTEDTTNEVAIASYAEAYNGLGYNNRGMASPYVYAGTDQYANGLYVADGKFSKTAKDRRLGVLALTRGIDGEGATDVHSGAPEDKRTPAQIWDAVLSGHILRRGQRGPEVEELQKRLTAAGFATGVDGDFGPGTEKAVKAMQTARGLDPDGVVGVDTAVAIRGGSPTTTTEGPSTPETDTPATTEPTAPAEAPAPAEWSQVSSGSLTLQRRASGTVVRYLQGLLIKAGFPLEVDGDFGRGTDRAVRAFQRARGLSVDGVVGSKTAGALV